MTGGGVALGGGVAPAPVGTGEGEAPDVDDGVGGLVVVLGTIVLTGVVSGTRELR